MICTQLEEVVEYEKKSLPNARKSERASKEKKLNELECVLNTVRELTQRIGELELKIFEAKFIRVLFHASKLRFILLPSMLVLIG